MPHSSGKIRKIWRNRFTHGMRESLSVAKDTRIVDREYELALIQNERQQQQFVSNALGFLIRYAVAMAECGCDSGTIEDHITDCAQAWGVHDIEISIIGRSIFLQHKPWGTLPTVVVGEASTMDAFNLNVMHGLFEISHLICSGTLSIGQADIKLRRLLRNPLMWPWYVTTLGGMLLACSITLQSNGSIQDAILAMFVLLGINRVGAALEKIAVFRFFQLLVQSVLIVCAGMYLYASGILSLQGSAALMGACIILILPIPQIVAVAEDAIRGFHITALSRSSGIILAIAALLIGVVGSISIARNTLLSSEDVLIYPTLNIWVAIIASMVGALGNGLFMNGWPRVLLPAAITGAVIGALNLFLVRQIGIPSPLAVAISGAVLGFIAVTIEKKIDVPAKALILTGVAGALLPGLDMYRSLIYLMLFHQGSSQYVLWTVFIVLSIGCGVVLGTSSAQTRVRIIHRRNSNQYWRNFLDNAPSMGFKGDASNSKEYKEE